MFFDRVSPRIYRIYTLMRPGTSIAVDECVKLFTSENGSNIFGQGSQVGMKRLHGIGFRGGVHLYVQVEAVFTRP